MRLMAVPDGEDERLAALRRYALSPFRPEPSLDRLATTAAQAVRVPIASIVLLEGDQAWAVSRVGTSVKRMERRAGLAATAVDAGRLRVLEDAREDPLAADHPHVQGGMKIRFFAAAPLTTPDGYHIGALVVADTEPRAFDQTSRDLLVSLADVVMDKLELRRVLEDVSEMNLELLELHEELRQRAATDALTGLWNKAAITDLFDRTLHRARREEEPVCALMMDIDYFKKVNDTFGHLAGDAVLREVARRLQGCLRHTDLVGRVGGEEFLAVLYPCRPDQAWALAERCRLAVRDQDIVVPTAQGDLEIPVTVSIGVTGSWSTPRSVDQMMMRADTLLYRSKEQGRNRVTAEVG